MTEQDQIKALAELGGYDWSTRQPMMGGGWMKKDGGGFCWCDENYLASYDAIMPLIQKQSRAVRSEIFNSFDTDAGWTSQAIEMMLATPAQLCEALLRSTGKWKE